MKLYHGSSQKIENIENRPLFFSSEVKDCEEMALGLDDMGEFNPESYIYMIEVDESKFESIEDFDDFDQDPYLNPDFTPEYSCHGNWFCVKNPKDAGIKLTLVSHTDNNELF